MEESPINDTSFGQFIREGKIMGSKCKKCEAVALPPRQICVHCYGTEAEWVEISGEGRLSAFTSIVVAPPIMIEKGFNRNNPYVVGVVELAGGLKMVARIIGVDAKKPQDIKVGMPLKVDFTAGDYTASERPCLFFRP
jgi:scaffold protein (connect acetoacetyl-CoA thiolase and HMG-CoA synthase)